MSKTAKIDGFTKAAGNVKARHLRRAFLLSFCSSYLLSPEPAPVGANVDPLGEALGAREFPDGSLALFGPILEPAALPVVLPVADGLLVAGELPAAVPTPPLCANANVLESAKVVASAMVVSFMVVSFG